METSSEPKWALRISSNITDLDLVVMALDFQPATLVAYFTNAGHQSGPNWMLKVGPNQVITLNRPKSLSHEIPEKAAGTRREVLRGCQMINEGAPDSSERSAGRGSGSVRSDCRLGWEQR
jgi:hypothetical protein